MCVCIYVYRWRCNHNNGPLVNNFQWTKTSTTDIPSQPNREQITLLLSPSSSSSLLSFSFAGWRLSTSIVIFTEPHSSMAFISIINSDLMRCVWHRRLYNNTIDYVFYIIIWTTTKNLCDFFFYCIFLSMFYGSHSFIWNLLSLVIVDWIVIICVYTNIYLKNQNNNNSTPNHIWCLLHAALLCIALKLIFLGSIWLQWRERKMHLMNFSCCIYIEQ